MPRIEWLRLTVECSEEIAEFIVGSLEAAAAQSISMSFPTAKVCSISALFEVTAANTAQFKQAIESIRENKDVLRTEQDVLKDRDWALEAQRSFKPLQIDDRLKILAPWHSAEESNSVLPIVITPGLAFGTGHHPTTQMCLEFLCRVDLAGATILDYGCGSGILALAALALGASYAWGVDIDIDAVAESEKNAIQNNFAGDFQALLPSQVPKNLAVNVVLANLYSKALVELAAKLTGYVKSSGWVIATGVLSDQVDETLQAFPSASTCTVHFKEEWAMLAMRF